MATRSARPYESSGRPITPVESDGTDVNSVSAAVVYLGRSSNDERTAAASEAGSYFVAVSLGADHGKSYQLPYELGVSVAGPGRAGQFGEPDSDLLDRRVLGGPDTYDLIAVG